MDLFDAYPNLMTLTDLDVIESGHGWVSGQSGGLVLKTFFPVDVEERDHRQQIKVYPNPVNSHVNISLSKGINNISLFNELGVSLHNEKLSGAKMHAMDLSGFPPGIYFVRIDARIRKIVKL